MFKPLTNRIVVKKAIDVNKTSSGLYVEGINSDIYEIVSVYDGYTDLPVGTKIIIKHGFLGLRVDTSLDPKTNKLVDLYCMDARDIIATVED